MRNNGKSRHNIRDEKYFVCGVLKNKGLLTGYTAATCPMHALRMLCHARGITVDEVESWSAHNAKMFEAATEEIPEFHMVET